MICCKKWPAVSPGRQLCSQQEDVQKEVFLLQDCLVQRSQSGWDGLHETQHSRDISQCLTSKKVLHWIWSGTCADALDATCAVMIDPRSSCKALMSSTNCVPPAEALGETSKDPRWLQTTYISCHKKTTHYTCDWLEHMHDSIPFKPRNHTQGKGSDVKQAQ